MLCNICAKKKMQGLKVKRFTRSPDGAKKALVPVQSDDSHGLWVCEDCFNNHNHGVK